jgi:hypothetical protein
LDQRHIINQQNALPLQAGQLNNWKQEIPAFSKPGKKTGSWMKKSTKLGESLRSLAFAGSH